MADKNIDIAIKTTADTTGAEKTEDALKQVGAETEKLNKEQQKNEAEQRAAEQAADVRRIKTIQIAQTLGEVSRATAQAAGGLREFSRDLRDIDPQLSGNVEDVAIGFDAIGASAQGAAAGMFLLGPPGALIGAVVAPAMAALKEEALGAVESLAKLKQIEKIADEMPARIEAMKKSMLVEQQSASWAALIEKMSEAEKQAASLQRVAQARRDLAEFEASQGVVLAKVGGGDVGAAEQNLRDVQAANFAAAQQDKIRTAEDAVVKAQTEYAIAQGLAARDAALNSEEQKRMAASIAKYRAALADAERNLKETREVSGIEGQKFGIAGQTKDKVSTFGKAKQDEAAAVQGINQLVEAVGTGGSKELQAAAQQLAQMASDNLLSAEELQKVPVLLAQFGGQIQRLGAAQNAALLDANSKIDQLIRDVSNLKTASTQAPR